MAEDKDNEKGRWESLKEKLRHTYRLVIMNNETFEEVGSYRLNLLNVYILISSIVVVVALLVVILIAFTPVRKYIPGYGDITDEIELNRLYQEMDSIEYELRVHKNYSENFRKILVGDVQTEDDIPESEAGNSDSLKAMQENLGDMEVDGQLRREIALVEIGVAAQQNRSNNLSPNELPIEQMYFSPPVTGEVSAGFMPDKKHYGVDILAPKNTAIKSAMDGYVFLSDWTLETGNTIGIQHANNTISFYKHNSVLLKKAGCFVKAGEAVAIIGNTGTLTSGPHLHFELWYQGKPLDPTEYINF